MHNLFLSEQNLIEQPSLQRENRITNKIQSDYDKLQVNLED